MNFNLPEEEEKILKFWKKNKIFEKSLEKNKKSQAFVFYEGPPTANGRPGIHHLLSRSFKDIICRFKTMEGFYVKRKAGWDTHGLPVELQVEKDTGIKSKKDIEKYGIEKFNEKCRKSVWNYKKEWEELTERIGYWLDMENPYITYDAEYIEILFGIIKKFYKKGLLYEDRKIVPWCLRCQTSLSSHEVSQGYKKVKENSIYIKFKIKPDQKIKGKEILENTYFLAWTTTPWTLPGNVALAINTEIDYVLVKNKEKNEKYILAKERITKTLDCENFEIVNEFKGKEIINLKYYPVFDLNPSNKPGYVELWTHKDSIFRLVSGDFVSTQDGTGIVHIAPAFGEDDFRVGKENNLPAPLTVTEDGKMSPGVIGEGKFIKDADKLIIEDLKKRNLLFLDKIHEHDYPFCWRCSSPLIYYLHYSWFVEVSKIRKKLTENNKQVNWFPSYLKDGRFGKFLEEARDWNFSRERYWGTPLPVWKCQSCNHIEVIGSKKDILSQKFSNNNYFILRHGLAETNVKKIISASTTEYHLTKQGKEKIKQSADSLSEKNIDIIFSSDVLRTRETAEIVSKRLNIKPQFSEKLREINLGIWEGKSFLEFQNKFLKPKTRLFKESPEGGETWGQCKMRMYKFLEEIDKKYSGKNILIISHGDPLWLLEGAIKGESNKELFTKTEVESGYIDKAEFRKIDFKKFPYDGKGELDFHRPYIDEIEFSCKKCGSKMIREKEVVDCWFDSGAMPFASKADFPADYICEAIDQTRGWFYTLLAVSTLLENKSPYRNVISLGHILDKKGKKMSKSKGNVVDPWEMIKKYGSDTIRWHLYTMNRPGDSKRFDENDLKKKLNRFILTFWNCYSFWDTYKISIETKIEDSETKIKPKKLLDKWIVSRLQALSYKTKTFLDNFDIVSAAREIEKFTIDDLSNWYIRRSRARFQKPKDKEDLSEASFVLGFVISELSKLSASFIPFLSEIIFKGIFPNETSVHIKSFPEYNKNIEDKKLEIAMEKVREIIAIGLAKRKEAKIKVRQPLASLKIKNLNFNFSDEMADLAKDELNVKEIKKEKGNGKIEIEFDLKITKELKEEGNLREIIRIIQGLRKTGKLTKSDKIDIFYNSSDSLSKFIEKNKKIIESKVIASKIFKENNDNCLKQKETEISGESFWIGIIKK